MDSSNKNVCMKCSINQECCKKFSLLMMSETEFKQHFAKHGSNFEVEQNAGLYLVRQKEGCTCPYWVGGKCTIHPDRPMDCRLFPYTIGKIFHNGNRVSIVFHSRSHCPHKEMLLTSKADAKEMLLAFGRIVFSDVDRIDVEHEWWFTEWKYRIMGGTRVV